jgi:Cu/Ag efflux protein CusF
MLRNRHRTVLISVLTALALACSGGDTPSPPDGTHTVRAEIVQVPADRGGKLYLRHESIPDFRNADGKQVGMAPMTMPFSAAEAVDLADLEAGDRIEIDFEVRWNGPTTLLVTRLEPLPEGTRLEFDPAPQPESELESEPEVGSDPPTGNDETPR